MREFNEGRGQEQTTLALIAKSLVTPNMSDAELLRRLVSEPEASGRDVTVHMHNDITGTVLDQRTLRDISEYLGDQVRDELNRRGVGYSREW